MCIRNFWYAVIFESHANNPKLKTGETVSRFGLNSSVKEPPRGESLLENQKSTRQVSFWIRKLRFQSYDLE